MGLAEDIEDLNKRIASLEKKREEVKKTLAVEEHKLSEIETQLKDEGYDVAKMTPLELSTLLDKLSEDVTKEQDRLELVLSEAEEQYERFQSLR